MSTSGTTAYSINELELYRDVLQSLGVLDGVNEPKAHVVAMCRRKLNMLVKQWTAQIDFAPGLKMWTRRRGYLFLQKGQTDYTIGASDSKAADESYASTTIPAGAASSASSIVVASASGIATTQPIGIELATGYLHWTTVNGAPSGTTVALTSALTAAAPAGARVFSYATACRRPFEIVTASRRDTDGNDTPIDPHMSLDEYESLARKSTVSTPSGLYFENKKASAKAFLNYSPDDVTDVIRFVYLSYVEDASANTTEVDFPPEWFRALSAQLQIDVAPVFSKQVTAPMKMARDEALAMAQNAHPATSDLYFEPEPDCY